LFEWTQKALATKRHFLQACAGGWGSALVFAFSFIYCCCRRSKDAKSFSAFQGNGSTSGSFFFKLQKVLQPQQNFNIVNNKLNNSNNNNSNNFNNNNNNKTNSNNFCLNDGRQQRQLVRTGHRASSQHHPASGKCRTSSKQVQKGKTQTVFI
jgi:hypothetical protein